MFGYYGKMPAHGDFVRSRADVGFVSGWDRWLQASFAQSRESLGAAWQAAYESAPIWRFALAAGVCGDAPVLGVMMPSQDRVGRCFPLTLFARLSRSAGAAALDTEPLMTGLEDAALETLGDGVRQDRLRARLDTLRLPDLPHAAGASGSDWLSTFFGGAPRRDALHFDALPAPLRFTDLMNPARGDVHV